MKNQNLNRILAAAGACMGLASIAAAQAGGGVAGFNGGLVNISGATLLENFNKSVASTADYIDCDGDGIAGYLGTNIDGFPGGRADQLAEGGYTGFAGQYFVINYRLTGSVNGFTELLNYGNSFTTTHAGDYQTRPGQDTNANGRWDAGEPFTDVNGNGLFDFSNTNVEPNANGIAINFMGAAQSNTAPNNVNPGRTSGAYLNRVLYIGNSGTNSGVRQAGTNPYNQGNPGGSPVRCDTTTLRATYNLTTDAPATGGFRIDISPLDVSTFLAVRKEPAGFTPAWGRRPAEAGYGTNPRRSVNKAGGTSGANFDNRLVSLPAGKSLAETFTDTNLNGVRDTGEAYVDSNQNGSYDAPVAGQTVFSTPLLFAPICPITNFGTGISQLTMTQIQHMWVTGRAANGENFMVMTRDVGSGTRNAWNNCTGVDPSWGNGDNIGAQSTSASQHVPGASFQPTNKGSGGNMLTSILNCRLGIGYAGPETGVSGSAPNGWMIRTLSNGTNNSNMEIVDVVNDIYAGNSGAAVRPTLTNLLNNNSNGWVIGGQAVLASIGDPLANGASAGGTGWTGAFDPYIDANNNNAYDVGEVYTDLNHNGVRDAVNAESGILNLNPPMANSYAAKYINNINRSIAAFTEVPNALENVFMPGEYATSQFISLSALQYSHTDADYTTLIVNPNYNAKLNAYVAANNTVYASSLIATANPTGRGLVPARLTGATYSDGVTGTSSFYINEAGSNINYGTQLHIRNKIAGDFNGSGARDSGDVAEMIKAFKQRETGGTFDWIPADGIYGAGAGVQACIEILGDFNNDGNFNKEDVRYYADGLFLVSGNLDRKAGFTEVDTQSLAIRGTENFFGTTKATGAPYVAGDARADVTNNGSATRGFVPQADNVINAKDIDYVYAQFNAQGRSASTFGVQDGEANWSDLNEAAYFDLSADINGDLVVNQADICEMLTILGTSYGDVNLDGTVDAADDAIITANLGTAGGWAQGDLNGDGQVTTDDIGFNGCFQCPPCPADFNNDGGVGGDDLAQFFQAYEAGNECGDTNGDGGVGGDDLAYFFAVYEAGGC